jgi:hypothetical protein
VTRRDFIEEQLHALGVDVRQNQTVHSSKLHRLHWQHATWLSPSGLMDRYYYINELEIE